MCVYLEVRYVDEIKVWFFVKDMIFYKLKIKCLRILKDKGNIELGLEIILKL